MSYVKRLIDQGRRIGGMNEAKRQLSRLNADMMDELREISKRMDKLDFALRSQIRTEVLKKAAIPLVEAAQELAPQSPKIHYDYGKSGGDHRIAYYPGNLKKSIQIMEFRRSPSVFVGPKVVKKARAKAYGRNNRNVNAFYASFVEFGTARAAPRPYMRPAMDRTKGQIALIAEREFRKVVQEYARRYPDRIKL